MSQEKLSLKAMKAEMMSPLINPLIEPQRIKTRNRWVKSGRSEDLVNPATGEITGVAAIHQIEERDDAEFVKVFADGVAASYDLTKTAQRVFQVVLDQYQRTPMSRGYADSVDLFWFGDGIEGRDAGMSERTWMRGLRELLDKRFIWPKTPTSFWVNSALFFKGDRVLFIREYRRKNDSNDTAKRMQKTINANHAEDSLLVINHTDQIEQAERDFIDQTAQHIDGNTEP